MPDTKVSALGELTAGNTDPADELLIVDKSDTAMAASGTTKRVKRSTLDALYQPDIAQGTVFPSSPLDGDIFIYNANLTDGVKWQFQYRQGSASAYKWEFIGGGVLYAEVAANQTLAAGAGYQALTTAGPSLTLPLTGDYDVEIGATAFNATGGASTWMSYDIGATLALDADAALSAAPNVTDAPTWSSIARARRKTAILAATALVAKYKRDVGTGSWQSRWMRVTPVRVLG